MKTGKRGQVAFESLFIVLVIMSAAVYISMLYLNTNEATVSTAIARDELFSQAIGMNSNVLLKYVHLSKDSSGGIAIEAATDPDTLRPADFNWTAVKNKLSKSTAITSLSVNVNGTPAINPS